MSIEKTSIDIGNGFIDHGVAVPLSNNRGIVATIDGSGKNIVLLWLFDCKGCSGLLWIDAENGTSKEYSIPFSSNGDCPYASLLSGRNKFYTHFNSHFLEFDPTQRAFTFSAETAPKMAMAMTESDDGVIWSVTYPNSSIAAFNPKTKEFTDYGQIHKENWPQYPRSLASDDKGWLYFAVGNTASHIIGFNPQTRTSKPLIPETERVSGMSMVFRDLNGKVYGNPNADGSNNWYELYNGSATKIAGLINQSPKPVITGDQNLFYKRFPDGSRIKECDTILRCIEVEDAKTGITRKYSFNYRSEGALIMGVAAAPDGTVCGGTAFPMRFFRYDPAADVIENNAAFNQYNTVLMHDKKFFIGGYPYGALLEWDPAKPWIETVKNASGCNPEYITECNPAIFRPHKLIADPKSGTVVLSGTPAYGYTGGGLLFWDPKERSSTLLTHTDIIPHHSTAAMAILPGGKLLAGTTTAPGTGGEKKAIAAELYIIDIFSKNVEWHCAVIPGAQEYTDLCISPSGMVFGFTDAERFFVFDPVKREIIHSRQTAAEFGYTATNDGPRVFVTDPKGEIYILFSKGIARVNLTDYTITLAAESPVTILTGGDYLCGRIYFSSGSHLFSYSLAKNTW